MSILSMNGEETGKILSTPMFPDIFLTVKVYDLSLTEYNLAMLFTGNMCIDILFNVYSFGYNIRFSLT